MSKTSWAEIVIPYLFFQNRIILRRPEVVNFADTVKIAIMLIEIIFKTSIKVKKNQTYEDTFFIVFRDVRKIANFSKVVLRNTYIS